MPKLLSGINCDGGPDDRPRRSAAYPDAEGPPAGPESYDGGRSGARSVLVVGRRGGLNDDRPRPGRGEMVAGLFGCRAQRENDRWFDVCRLSLMHLRVGMSAGFTARRHCSLCGLDLTVCDHIPGDTYPVIAGRQADGGCTICNSPRCLSHTPGARYPVVAHPITRQADLQEISTVTRPRDPLARCNAVEIPAYAIASLPNQDDPNASLHCEWCIAPCTGFTSVEEALGFA